MRCLICGKERKYPKKCSRCKHINCSGCNEKGVCLDCLAKEICES